MIIMEFWEKLLLREFAKILPENLRDEPPILPAKGCLFISRLLGLSERYGFLILN